ncbi:MAG: tetratricopeptide repeat protein [Candidatus Eiseniibacteriota bacterium]
MSFRPGRWAWVAAAVAGAVVQGCDGGGPDEARLDGQAAAYRSRAEAAEQGGDSEEALASFRDAARRYPTEAWAWSGAGRAASRLGRFDDAEQAWLTAVRWDSSLVAERVALAEIALEDGRAAEAVARMDEAVRAGGESPEALALRGLALAAAGRAVEARTAVDRALALGPESITARIARARLALAGGSSEEAVAELERLAGAHPEDPDVHSALARGRLASGDGEGARTALARALALDSGRPPDRRLRARLLLDSADFDGAAREFARLLRDNPRDAVALEGIGACAFAKGDPEAAEAAFQHAIESAPESADAHFALARFRIRQGRFDEAVALLRRARARALAPALQEQIDATLAEAYLALGEPQNAAAITDGLLHKNPASPAGRAVLLAHSRWLLEHGDAAQAQDLAGRALAADSTDAEALVARAEASAALGRTAEAERELRALLAAGRGGAATYLALARLCLAGERLREALSFATEGERLAPDEPDFAVIRGFAAMQQGDAGAARTAFERERELRPESPKPWMNLGQLEMDAGDPARAAECFAEAQKRDPAGWFPSYQLGLALDRAGRAAEAIDAYKAVLSRNERVAEAHNNLAWLLADREIDPVLAEVHARRAVELAPDNANVLGTLGWTQYRNGLLDEAVTSLERAKKLEPRDSMKRYLLGVVRLERGEAAAARAELTEALRLDPAFPRREDARRLLDRLD